MKKSKLQPIRIPGRCRITKNDFTTYNPEDDYSEERNLQYLTENLLQIEIEHLNLIVDLGWYGNILTNDGNFKIFIIKNKDWENPIRIESSISQNIITEKLELILLDIYKYGSINTTP